MRLTALIFLSLSFSILAGTRAFAFPELTRHGYPNCMVCHISPTGGGVLSEYGRSLSKELLSTWGRENEERFLYIIPTTERWALGGDIRNVQVEDKLPTGEKKKRWIPMQKDLAVALTVDKWVGDVAIGENTMARGNESKTISRRHYLMYKKSDELTIRGGRFYPSFGLHLPEHNSVIRRGLGWDQGMESYNLEGAWQGEKWHYFATGVFGRPDDNSLVRERGFTLSTAYHPSTHSKFGLSYYYGENPNIINHYLAPYTVMGFGEKLYLMAQLTLVRGFPYLAQDPQWGLVDYLRFNYEPYKGVHLYLAQEFSQMNLYSQTTRTDTHTLGFQFFPRPHFEVHVQAQKLYTQGISSSATDRMNVLFHFYP